MKSSRGDEYCGESPRCCQEQSTAPGLRCVYGLRVLCTMETSMALGIPGAMGYYVLLWIAPLVALKATTCVIQGVVYCRLVTVYLLEMVQYIQHQRSEYPAIWRNGGSTHRSIDHALALLLWRKGKSIDTSCVYHTLCGAVHSCHEGSTCAHPPSEE